MIFNLAKYINNNVSEDAIVNGSDPDINQSGLYLNETGGSTTPVIGTKEKRIQAIYKSESRFYCRQRINTVYNLLVGDNGAGRWGIDFPATTITDGEEEVVFPLVHTAQILPIQEPGYIGADVNGLHMFSVNFKITLGG